MTTHVPARKDTLGPTADNLCVKTVVRMADVVSGRTDAPVFTDSLDLNVKEITGLDHVSHKSSTKCVKVRSAVLCAQRHCAAPPLAAPGVTPVRCVPLNHTRAEGDSFQISELEPAKMWMNVKLYPACAKVVTVSTQWDPMSVNAQLDTSRARPHRSVKILMNVAQAPMCVMEGSAPTPPGALSVYVREGLLQARTARAASIRGPGAASLH